jgi:Domain of unknown function (DUF4342)
MRAGWESFKVKGDELLERVRQLIHEGNVQRVVIKQGDQTIAEFPLTVGVVGALVAPVLAAIGALAAVLTDCTVYVRRAEPKTSGGRAKPASGRTARKKTARGR